MSSYVVSHATITVVVEALTPALDERCSPEQAREKRTRLGQDLLELNYAAIRARYGDKEPARVMLANAYPYEHPGNVRTLPLLSTYKVLQCFQCQCSEGDVPGEKLYARVKNTIDELGHEIVQSLPAYDAAPWGLE